MNQRIYHNNIEAISENYKEWLSIIENKEYNMDEDIIVETEVSKTYDIILKVKKNKRKYYLNGKYNPGADFKDYIVEKKYGYSSVITLVGMSDCMNIKSLMKKTNGEGIILVYEPSINIFLKVIEEIDISELIGSKQVVLIINGLNEDDFEVVYKKLVTYDNITVSDIYISGNYTKLFYERISKIQQFIIKYVDNIIIQWNTVVRYTTVNAKNVLHNILYLYDGYSISQLANCITEDIPVIIVSAGPSLNKNIKELKRAKNKACIIATDTALKPLLKEGIIPDFFAIVDGKKPTLLFEHELLSKIPAITCSMVAKDVMAMHHGKKIFYFDGSDMVRTLLNKAREGTKNSKIGMESLPSGGSVANSAFSAGVLMGARTIILMGQDLAFTNNKTHADGTFKKEMEEIDISTPGYIQVEGIDGKTFVTRDDFYRYLLWFEDYIRNYPEVKVIDATEGGALIHGTEILTLREAIDRECKSKINIEELLNKLSPLFDEDAKKKVLEFFNDFPKGFIEVKKKARQGIKAYRQMWELCKKQDFSVSQFAKLTKKIEKINNFMNTDMTALFTMDSLKGLEYTMRATMYHTKENENDERISIAKDGILILEYVLKCADILLELAENTVGRFQPEVQSQGED